MKKASIIIFIIIIVSATACYIYKTYENKAIQNMMEYKEIEKYENTTLSSNDVSTIINLVTTINKKNGIEYNKKGFSTSNNAIKVYIKLKDSNKQIDGEQIYIDGIDRFAFYYDGEIFNITEIVKDKNKIKQIIIKQVE